jgi:hydroxymethylglutaryl-CoA reductase
MSQDTNSRWPGFFKLSIEERIGQLAERAGLQAKALSFLRDGEHLPVRTANHMIENCIGTFELPLGLAMNLRVDGVDRLVPMAIEEPSVLAGLSKAARYLRSGPGIITTVAAPVMIGQVQLLEVPDLDRARERVLEAKQDLLDEANRVDPTLVTVGGGARDVEVRILPPEGPMDPVGTMFVVHLLVDVQDAMGANAVNTMVEGLAPRLEQLTGGRARLRILSNLADRRLVTARGQLPVSRLGGNGDSKLAPELGLSVALGVEEASVFAERDPYRAATHNKGIMNGIDGVLVALGQDWRAVESGAHAFAARSGRYRALSKWRVTDNLLRGELELPLAVGTVGGIVKSHPAVQAGFAILDVKSAAELAAVAAAVGLAQNLAALCALATVGIQHGHMRLHARKVGMTVGATEAELEPLFEELKRRGRFDRETAAKVLATLREAGG